MNARMLLWSAVLLAAVGTAQAGRPCETRPSEAASVERAMGLAKRTAQALEATGAQVVVLARKGQDLSKYRLRWSHLALACREGGGGQGTDPGAAVWRVVHKLNDCGSARADLYRQGLGEFFMNDLFEFKAGIAVLRPEVQTHLLAVLRDNQRVAQLHQPAYSMVAYPWAQTYQQSNQWAIETLAMVEEPGADTRERAQAWLAFEGYAPTTLHLSAFTRLGARMTAANVAFDDHPNEKRFSDRIETVTVDSVFAWLHRTGLAGRVVEVR